MKFTWHKSEDDIIDITLSGGRTVRFILHVEEFDVEASKNVTDDELQKLTDWVIDRFSPREESGQEDI